MKAILLAALLSGISSASQDPPAQVRVCVQYIEVSHPALTELLGGGETGGHAIHAQARALAEKGDAKILETAMVVCRSGYKSFALSILEEIYPTEYDPESLTSNPRYPDNATRSFPSFETKDTGFILDAELTVDKETGIIDLRCRPEFMRRMRVETWFEHTDEMGDASMRMPIFEKWGSDTALSLRSGKSELASVINPKDQPAPPAVSRRILLFVRADILEPPSQQ
jgi:hypothetical protein